VSGAWEFSGPMTMAAISAISEARDATVLPDGCSAPIKCLHEYWQGIRPAPALLPGRGHLVLRDIAPLLRHIWLVDVVGDPIRFRYRVLGTTIDQLIGNHLNGAWLDEVHTEFVRS